MNANRSLLEYNLSVKDVHNITKYTEAYIRDLANDGTIPHIRRGREYRFNLEDVQNALLRVPGKPAREISVPSERGETFETQETISEDIDDIDLGV